MTWTKKSAGSSTHRDSDYPQVSVPRMPRPPESAYGGAVTSRDSHRSAVYAAEEQWAHQLARGGAIDFLGSRLQIPVERRFADIASVQRYVDAVLGLIGVVTQWPGVSPVRVRERGVVTASVTLSNGVSIPINDIYLSGARNNIAPRS